MFRIIHGPGVLDKYSAIPFEPILATSHGQLR